ncbi:MAG: hypothetical protein ABII71_00830 [Candidatus Micrarchaeota archaeon]
MYSFEGIPQPEWVDRLQREYMMTGSNTERGEALIRQRMEEAVEKPGFSGNEEVRRILRMPVLSDPALIIALEIASRKFIGEVDQFLYGRDCHPSDDVKLRGIEILAEYGLVFAVVTHAHEFVRRDPDEVARLETMNPENLPENYIENRRAKLLDRRRKIENAILDGIRVLVGEKPKPNGIAIRDSAQIIDFIFTNTRFMSDELKLDIIEVLDRNGCHGPFGNLATYDLESLLIRETAKKVLEARGIPLDSLPRGLGSLGMIRVVDDEPKGKGVQPKEKGKSRLN